MTRSPFAAIAAALFAGIAAVSLRSGLHHGIPGQSLLLGTLDPLPRTGHYRSGPINGHSRPTRMQAHTGAGGAGAHRAWKRRRAAGRQ